MIYKNSSCKMTRRNNSRAFTHDSVCQLMRLALRNYFRHSTLTVIENVLRRLEELAISEHNEPSKILGATRRFGVDSHECFGD